MEIGTIISVISIVIAVLSFFFARKDKSTKEASSVSYNRGVQDTNYQNIMAKLNKIEEKLETYDKAFKTTAEEVKDELKEFVISYVKDTMEKHRLEFHHKE